jgi:hypothetical protein
MPNWVNNHLYIHGDPETVASVTETLKRPVTYYTEDGVTEEHTPNAISFVNIVPPPTEPHSARLWNLANWNTKWDACEEGYEEETADYVHLMFDTAWSPVTDLIERLAAMFPKAALTYNYQEETGWGGEVEYADGKVKSTVEWEDADERDEVL